MRIGVVCEGPTDFVAISTFLSASLDARGRQATFVDIQPNIDASSARGNGGWSNALVWLRNNPRSIRRNSILGSGLFANNLSAKKCDLLFIQIDVDCIDDDSFANYIQKNYPYKVSSANTAVLRFNEIERVLLLLGGYGNAVDARQDDHVFAPAVENTETWCVAVRDPDVQDVEQLDKAAILSEFGLRLASFDGGHGTGPTLKNIKRRAAYCTHHKGDFERIEGQCAQYMRALLAI